MDNKVKIVPELDETTFEAIRKMMVERLSVPISLAAPNELGTNLNPFAALPHPTSETQGPPKPQGYGLNMLADLLGQVSSGAGKATTGIRGFFDSLPKIGAGLDEALSKGANIGIGGFGKALSGIAGKIEPIVAAGSAVGTVMLKLAEIPAIVIGAVTAIAETATLLAGVASPATAMLTNYAYKDLAATVGFRLIPVTEFWREAIYALSGAIAAILPSQDEFRVAMETMRPGLETAQDLIRQLAPMFHTVLSVGLASFGASITIVTEAIGQMRAAGLDEFFKLISSFVSGTLVVGFSLFVGAIRLVSMAVSGLVSVFLWSYGVINRIIASLTGINIAGALTASGANAPGLPNTFGAAARGGAEFMNAQEVSKRAIIGALNQGAADPMARTAEAATNMQQMMNAMAGNLGLCASRLETIINVLSLNAAKKGSETLGEWIGEAIYGNGTA